MSATYAVALSLACLLVALVAALAIRDGLLALTASVLP